MYVKNEIISFIFFITDYTLIMSVPVLKWYAIDVLFDIPELTVSLIHKSGIS